MKFLSTTDCDFLKIRDCKNEPSVFSLVKGEEVRTVLLMRRIPMTDVPDDEIEAAAWLHRLYQEKVCLTKN